MNIVINQYFLLLLLGYINNQVLLKVKLKRSTWYFF